MIAHIPDAGAEAGDRRHHQGRRAELAAADRRADDAGDALEGPADRDLRVRRAARGRLHRRRHPERPGGARRSRTASPTATGCGRSRWWRRSPACCIGWNPGSPTTWRSACWRTCASTCSASSMQLAPAYLVRRRTGDLMALATHDIELVEYFFAHTVAPAFVAILVPGVGAGVAGRQLAVAAAGAAAVPGCGRAVPVPAARQGRPARLRGARSGRRARRLRGRLGAGPRRDRRLPAGAARARRARRAVATPRAAAPAVLSRADLAGQPARDLHRPRRPRRRGRRRDA